MTFFGWVRYILWIIVVDSSFQYQGPDGSYSTTDNVSQTSNVCACSDKEGNLYNLEPLGSKDETPRFAKFAMLRFSGRVMHLERKSWKKTCRKPQPQRQGERC